MISTLYKNEVEGLEWIDIVFPTKEELNKIAHKHNLHQHAVEDCLEPNHLPKFEIIDKTLFLILRVFDNEAIDKADSIQELTRKIAIFFTGKTLITIHRREQPLLLEIKDTFCTKVDMTLEKLMIEIIRKSVFTFEPPITDADKVLDAFETKIFLKRKTPNIIRDLYFLKRKVDVYRRMLLLTKDLMVRFKNETQIDNPTLVDLKETTERIFVDCEQVRDNLNQLLSIHFNLSTQRVNEVIVVLTLFSGFFMPLTFIVGVYGMNFKFMPELEERNGYFILWGVMILITLVIFQWFKRKKWL